MHNSASIRVMLAVAFSTVITFCSSLVSGTIDERGAGRGRGRCRVRGRGRGAGRYLLITSYRTRNNHDCNVAPAFFLGTSQTFNSRILNTRCFFRT